MVRKLRLTNDYHNTEIVLLIRPVCRGWYIGPRQVKRAKKTLCGVAGCSCSGELGIRGMDNIVVYLDYENGAKIIQLKREE